MYTIQEQKSSGGDGECRHISHNSASGFINGNYCRGGGMWEIYHDMCVWGALVMAQVHPSSNVLYLVGVSYIRSTFFA